MLDDFDYCNTAQYPLCGVNPFSSSSLLPLEPLCRVGVAVHSITTPLRWPLIHLGMSISSHSTVQELMGTILITAYVGSQHRRAL